MTLLDRDREKGGEARTESKQRQAANRRTRWEGFERNSHGEKGSEALLFVRKKKKKSNVLNEEIGAVIRSI